MADLVITPANVIAQNAVIDNGIGGVALTAGQTVYKEAATGLYKLADSNSATLEARNCSGIALNPCAINQPVAVALPGSNVVIGATLVAGSAYYLSETPGGIQPVADLGATENVCQLGFATSTTVLALRISIPGVVL